MTEEHVYAGNLRLVGGTLCLDFVNTVNWHISNTPDELLKDYEDFVVWGVHVGILSNDQATILREASQQRAQIARAVVDDAIALREALFRLFLAKIQNQPVAPKDLAHFNSILEQADTRLQLTYADAKYKWEFPLQLDCIQWPVVWSAAVMLTSEHLDSVRMCEGPGCGWLFLDTSRNQRRRWCSMDSCGNRAKAKRHYEKSKSEDG